VRAARALGPAVDGFREPGAGEGIPMRLNRTGTVAGAVERLELARATACESGRFTR